MSDRDRLVFAFLQFLQDEIGSGQLSGDAAESLEVTVQCLETAFGITPSDPEVASRLRVSKPLLSIFQEATKDEKPAGPTAEQKEEAEGLKNEGNNLMKSESFSEAIEYYNKAIVLDPTNAVYYCNRAAAYSKTDQHLNAVQDCQKAINIDSTYSKPYGRMGLAYTGMNRHAEAKVCYAKALELDPENQSYQNNMRISEERLKDLPGDGAAGGLPLGGAMNAGGMDFGSLLSNPALMNMATQMMSNPMMQNLMSDLMSGASTRPDGQQGLSTLLQAGQELASQMQHQNPELVDMLRQQMTNQQQPPQPDEQPPPPPPGPN
ncbi:PREDICTED: small glutamine-rich tetratricopeptide repeat-containing protein alpha-like [Priapulus caudatus]|uniref:Small glutamine-rich tetratricopeptide repeat-containing protein alpha-like n=1 Tax=Priapulus caudatus TaxID=37621 RepID=A0ABM1E1D4_PRICU|nr:PREDICTED: small glutamine-rich tetratricopeptide repeat-containing protein alpha-like [Priapulus caudatus]